MMKILTSTISGFKTLPVSIRSFLLKAIFIFIGWKLLYVFLLQPLRIPDAQLTDITAYSTQFVYTTFNNAPAVSIQQELKEKQNLSVIYINDKRGIGIADSCNGLELYVLYLGYLLCIPTNRKRFFSFAIIGVGGIFVLNILRCYGLCIMALSHSSYTNFAHHYLFKIIIYTAIFLIWVQYSKNYFERT
jgi:exosortase/archaeosortase family protein